MELMGRLHDGVSLNTSALYFRVDVSFCKICP